MTRSHQEKEAAKLKRAEEDIEELTNLHRAAIAERDAARAELVLAKAETRKAEFRLDACLFAMVLMQAQLRLRIDRENQEQARKAMGGDTVSLAG